MPPLITMPSTISLLNSLKQILPKQHRRKILKSSRNSRQESLIKSKPEEMHSSRLTVIDTILDGRESALLGSFIILLWGLEAHPWVVPAYAATAISTPSLHGHRYTLYIPGISRTREELLWRSAYRLMGQAAAHDEIRSIEMVECVGNWLREGHIIRPSHGGAGLICDPGPTDNDMDMDQDLDT